MGTEAGVPGTKPVHSTLSRRVVRGPLAPPVYNVEYTAGQLLGRLSCRIKMLCSLIPSKLDFRSMFCIVRLLTPTAVCTHMRAICACVAAIDSERRTRPLRSIYRPDRGPQELRVEQALLKILPSTDTPITIAPRSADRKSWSRVGPNRGPRLAQGTVDMNFQAKH